MNGVDQFVAGRVFQEKAGGARALCPRGHVHIVVHRQQDDLAVDALGFQPGQHVEATQSRRHRDVRDDHIRSKPDGGVDEQVTVTHRAHYDQAVLRQQLDQAFPDHCVVVGEEHGGAA